MLLYDVDWLRKRRVKVVHAALMLRKRELGINRPGTQFLCGAYEFYQCVHPSKALHGIDRKGFVLKRFSPCGRYLICFTSTYHSVSVRNYTTFARAYENVNAFEDVFPERFTLNVVSDAEEGSMLMRDCLFITPDSRHIIVAVESMVSDAAATLLDLYRNNESLVRVSSQALSNITFITIDLQDGSICDRYQLNVDRVWVTHGVHLVGRLFAILSLQHQTIHFLHIDERTGSFVVLNKVGRHLYDDDDIVSMGMHDDDQVVFTGLKQRLLTALYRRCVRAGCVPQFLHMFSQLRSLRMWQMQIIDSDLVLIRFVQEDAFTSGAPISMAPAVYVFYDWRNAEIINVFERNSQHFGKIVERCLEELKHPELLDNRFPCTAQYCQQGALLYERIKFFLVHITGESRSETYRRLVSQLPFSTTLAPTNTPYLDPSMFSYDDRLLAIVERMRLPDKEVVKFHSRVTGLPLFKMIVSRGRYVQLLFHPSEPFAISADRSHPNTRATFHVPPLVPST
uniref:DET1 n=2 Tax=Ascaris TaxID=6251 RepID=F1L532_ASCSU